MDRASVLESLYWLSRGAIGFSLIVGGAAILFKPERNRAQRCLGMIFASVGLLFCFSALDLGSRVPEALGNFLIIAAFLALSQAQFELTVYTCPGRRGDCDWSARYFSRASRGPSSYGAFPSWIIFWAGTRRG